MVTMVGRLLCLLLLRSGGVKTAPRFSMELLARRVSSSPPTFSLGQESSVGLVSIFPTTGGRRGTG